MAVQLVLNTVLCQSKESEIPLLFGTFWRNLTNFRTKLSTDEIFAKHVASKYHCTLEPSHKGVSCNICMQNFSTIVFFLWRVELRHVCGLKQCCWHKKLLKILHCTCTTSTSSLHLCHLLVFIKFGYSINCSIVFTQAISLLQWSCALHLIFHMLMAILSRRLHSTIIKVQWFTQKAWRSPLPALTCTNFKEVLDECSVWNLGNGLEAFLAVVCQLCMYTVPIYIIPQLCQITPKYRLVPTYVLLDDRRIDDFISDFFVCFF